MADAPCACEKWIRARFSENLRPSACQHHRSFLCIAARPLAMVCSFSSLSRNCLIAAGGFLTGKLLRATLIVKRETSITGELWAAFTAAAAASTLAEIANFSRAQPQATSRSRVRTCGIECLFMCRFLDAGMTNPSTRCGDRRPKSAKARSRGKLGTGWAAGAMRIARRRRPRWKE